MSSLILLIDEEKAKKIALKVLTSKFSKSTKRHYLRALEHHMAYLGKPMKFKKPHDTMRCPEYLDQAQMSKLIRASRNYREMAVLTLFCTTGVRLGELVNIDIKDLDLERKNIRVHHC